MKICHIIIKNFRSLEYFDDDFGKYNIILGKNNTGKSNLLWAINYFYNPKDLTREDFFINQLEKKSEDNIENEKELQIILTYDNLNEIEKSNNTKYVRNGIIKIMLKAWIDKTGKIIAEHHGYIQSVKFIYPKTMDPELKNILENEKPKRSDFEKHNELKKIMENYVLKGVVTKDHMIKIKEEYISKHPEIKRKNIEVLSDSKYRGFIKTNDPQTIGECFFIPAIKDPAEELSTIKSNSPVNQLIRSILRDIETKEIKKSFKEVQRQILKEREKNIIMLEDNFKKELELFDTSLNIKLKDIEISDAFPLNIDLLFNDGILTSLNNKGTGLQRYVFFKFLKIKNELNLSNNVSFLLLFEEPEAHLHPQFQREIAKILENISESGNYQTFITTHSPQFIDLLNLDYVFIFNKEKECTKSKKCEIKLLNIKEEIKTILFFDPHIKEIFFSERIILLEGQSEAIIANVLIQEGKLNVSDVSIIDAKSKYNIPTFLNVFNALKIRYTVLIDEDSYFIPHYKKKNPTKINDKKKAYKKTLDIAELIDDSIGKLIVVSPDFDTFLGVSKNQIDKVGKPTAIYKKFQELEKDNMTEVKKIEDLFNLLLNPESLKFKISKTDGSKWEFKNEDEVKIPIAEFEDLKDAISERLKTYDKVVSQLSFKEIEELKNLLNVKKPVSKTSAKVKKDQSTKNLKTSKLIKGPMNNWLNG